MPYNQKFHERRYAYLSFKSFALNSGNFTSSAGISCPQIRIYKPSENYLNFFYFLLRMKRAILISAVTLATILAAPECAAAQEFRCEKIIHGRIYDALNFYQKAEQTPENLYCLANLHRLEKKNDEALEVLAKIETDKLDKERQEQVLASFASVYFDKGEYQNMKKSYESLLQLNPKSHFKDLAAERIKQTS